jgi:hypothetical protein
VLEARDETRNWRKLEPRVVLMSIGEEVPTLFK